MRSGGRRRRGTLSNKFVSCLRTHFKSWLTRGSESTDMFANGCLRALSNCFHSSTAHCIQYTVFSTTTIFITVPAINMMYIGVAVKPCRLNGPLTVFISCGVRQGGILSLFYASCVRIIYIYNVSRQFNPCKPVLFVVISKSILCMQVICSYFSTAIIIWHQI